MKMRAYSYSSFKSMAVTLLLVIAPLSYGTNLNISNTPLFVSETVPPLVMLTLGRNHKFFYEAYNDASDLDSNGTLDVGYLPGTIERYFGYFENDLCYDYVASEKEFVPVATTDDPVLHTCTSTDAWSGDFLNYVTMSRIDALRAVLYGGKRAVDTADRTVLERAFIPQDAHSWGKEYDSIDSDGYDIRDYTPLNLPALGTRHLFANTSPLDDGEVKDATLVGRPLMRVLNDSRFRVWEWLSTERPVAGLNCRPLETQSATSCERSSSGDEFTIVPPIFFSDLRLRRFANANDGIEGTSVDSREEFDDLQAFLLNTAPIATPFVDEFIPNINQPSENTGDQLFNLIEGELIVPEAGSYTFGIDGDDAVEFIIFGNDDSSDSDDFVVDFYGNHGFSGNPGANQGTVFLNAGTHRIQFRHHENGGGEGYQLFFEQGAAPDSLITDFVVQVEVCGDTFAETPGRCKAYGDALKPIGILQEFGDDERMMFGLLMGSNTNNLDGGVIRKLVSPFTDEVNPVDGTFNVDADGIVKSIDLMRIFGFGGNFVHDCGFTFNRVRGNGECQPWGNPLAEMMYEGLRYFSGKTSPTSDFFTTAGDDALFPAPDWVDPYGPEVTGNPATGFQQCAQPFQLVMGDVNANYDSDKVPGTRFGSFTGDISGLNVGDEADFITSQEANPEVSDEPIEGNRFIGEVITDGGTIISDSAPSSKPVTSLANIRGLAPEEPTKQGSYYAASIASFARRNDIRPDDFPGPENDINMQTFAVAVASPFPTFDFNVGGNTVTLVPFAKSVGGGSINAAEGAYQPTDQIVDFYVERLDATEGSFLINFEDVEQGGDHDMDAIVRYRYEILNESEIEISMESIYAAGSVIQHMGYVISGTTQDGVYLEVRDRDTSVGNDVEYFLDTPAGTDASTGRGNVAGALPLAHSRTFVAAEESVESTLLRDPLYYAAKWGGFQEQVENNIPEGIEWDADFDGNPDNYFPVTNALTLGDQLASAFDEIISRVGASASAAVNSGSLSTESLLFQASFTSEIWTGDVRALEIELDGSLGNLNWSAQDELQNLVSGGSGSSAEGNPGGAASRTVISFNGSLGVPFQWTESASVSTDTLSAAQLASLVADYSTSDINGDSVVDEDDTNLIGEAIVAFLRGDQSNEIGDADGLGAFRDRVAVLGDIVSSDPLFVAAPPFFYNLIDPAVLPEGQSYLEFKNSFADRRPMLYTGANDGMLHAFDATRRESGVGTGGVETLAYIPGFLVDELSELANPAYVHRFFVDGPPTMGDVYIPVGSKIAEGVDDGTTVSRWRTVLVGGLGAGGQGVYALDITDPSELSEASAEDLVLWEFTDGNDPELGFTFSKPQIGRMANGRWAAIFGNGYNSSQAFAGENDAATGSGSAKLFIVDIETGEVVTGFSNGDTEAGIDLTNVEAFDDRPNGLSSPNIVDINGDAIVDFIYAGDLYGNLWKWDVRDPSANNWDFAYKEAGNPVPLFIARGSDTAINEGVQPITSQPEVGRTPAQASIFDVLVYFGTGKYLEPDDNSQFDQLTQTFYGVRDKQATGGLSDQVQRADLVEQEILAEFAFTAEDGAINVLRTVSDNIVNYTGEKPDSGFFLELTTGSTDADGNEINGGERVVFDPQLFGDRVVFTTLIPSTSACDFGGSGFLFELDAGNGGAFTEQTFDINNDGDIDGDDLATDANVVTSGIQIQGGIPSIPVHVDNNRFISESSGNVFENAILGRERQFGRQVWREATPR